MVFLSKKKGCRRRGFTLLELLIVVIIIGILGTLALPRFFRAVERARWAEARSILGALRTSQLTYRAQYGSYASSMDSLDMDLTSGTVYGKYFLFVVCNWWGENVAYVHRTGTQDTFGLAWQWMTISSNGDYGYSGGIPAWLR